MKTAVKILLIAAIVALVLYLYIPVDSETTEVNATDEVVVLTDVQGELAATHYEIGDICKFTSGSGTTTHKANSDVSKYNSGAQVTVTMVVDSLPVTYDSGWDDYGTLRITEFAFNANSDLVYIPSFIIYKSTFDGASHIYLYKVVAIDNAAKQQLNERGMEIVLPKALRGETFGSNVTVTTEGLYVDTHGNTVHYSVDETMTAYMNGYGGYSMYTYSDNADYRYCEQGTVTSVDYAPGQTTYDTKMCQWSKYPMTSCDRWVCGSFADMIGTVITGEDIPEPVVPNYEKERSPVIVITAFALLLVGMMFRLFRH